MDLTKNLSIWRSAEVPLLPGVSAGEVVAAFRSIGWEPTPDVLSMYAQLGGLAKPDAEYWRLWRPTELKKGNADRSPLGVYFSDYLSEAWSFLLKPNGTTSAVLRDNFDGNLPYQVAATLEEFFTAYATDPIGLIDPESRRADRDA